jgi:bifunctional UDP-N-acetylglucosamine pyrophosphorylase/glucosamine-1-phosphate N-acetyltransferase
MYAIVLAAGSSRRFGTENNKLVTPLSGVPLIVHSMRVLQQMHIPTTVVVGHQREQLQEGFAAWNIEPHSFAIQDKQRGTGHAVACSRIYWIADSILVINGDMPLITQQTITTLYEKHCTHHAIVSFVAAVPDTLMHEYGRVVHTHEGVQIVEAKDFVGAITDVCPINAGLYLFDRNFLEQSIDSLDTNNASNELYLTGLVGMASKQGHCVLVHETPFDEVRGVNTPIEFAKVQSLLRKNIIEYWMHHGVLCSMPETINIDVDVFIGQGTILHAGVQLRGRTIIGKGCVIDAYTIIEHGVIRDHAYIKPHSVIREDCPDIHMSESHNTTSIPNLHNKSRMV